MGHELNKTKQGGFTLLELIIVMAIIGVLASSFIIQYPGIQKTARDTQRRNDLTQYRTALERYSIAHSNVYPVDTSGSRISTVAYCNTTLGISGTCPADPRDNGSVCSGQTCGYFYRTNVSGTSYVLWAPLEKPANTARVYLTICSNGNIGETGNLTTDGTCPTIP